MRQGFCETLSQDVWLQIHTHTQAMWLKYNSGVSSSSLELIHLIRLAIVCASLIFWCNHRCKYIITQAQTKLYYTFFVLCFEWGDLLPAAGGQEKASCQSTKALQTKGRAISEIILQLQKAQEFLQINTTKAESSRQESSTAEHQTIALWIYPKCKAAVSQQKLVCTGCRDWEGKSQIKILKCSSKWMELRQKDLSKEQWCKIHSNSEAMQN